MRLSSIIKIDNSETICLDSSKHHWFWVLSIILLVIIVFLSYYPSFDTYLFGDDYHWMNNTLGSSIYDLFNPNFYQGFWYRPTFAILLNIIYSIFGNHLFPYKLANVLIHLLNSILLLYYLTIHVKLNRHLSLICSLSFMTYYVYSFDVLWVSNCCTMLVGLFYITALIMGDKYLQSKRKVFFYINMILFYLALLSKEIAIIILPMLIVQKWINDREVNLLEILREYAPFILILALYLVMMAKTLIMNEGYGRYSNYGLGLHTIENLPKYIYRFFDCSGISKYSEFLQGILVIIIYILTIVVLKCFHRVKFFIIHTIVAILPFCLLNSYIDYRYLYIPGIGFCVLSGMLIWEALRKDIRHAGISILAAIFLIFNISGIHNQDKIIEAAWTQFDEAFIAEVKAMYPTFPTGTLCFSFTSNPSISANIRIMLKWVYNDYSISILNLLSKHPFEKPSGDIHLVNYDQGKLYKIISEVAVVYGFGFKIPPEIWDTGEWHMMDDNEARIVVVNTTTDEMLVDLTSVLVTAEPGRTVQVWRDDWLMTETIVPASGTPTEIKIRGIKVQPQSLRPLWLRVVETGKEQPGQIYLRSFDVDWSPLEKPSPQRIKTVTLGDQVRLLGYDLEPEVAKAGERLTLILYWQAMTSIQEDYTIFTHLLNEGGHVSAQHDGQPVNSSYPTSKWEEGEIVKDEHALLIPPDTPAGRYTLEVGMYLLSSMERLQATDGVVGTDHLILESLIVIP